VSGSRIQTASYAGKYCPVFLKLGPKLGPTFAPSHWLKIVRKILCRDQPLIGTILRIAGDHVTRLRRSSLFICLRNADATYILAGFIRAKLSICLRRYCLNSRIPSLVVSTTGFKRKGQPSGHQPSPNNHVFRGAKGTRSLKITFAELLRSCSRNISAACCLACVTRVAGRSTRPPLSFILAVLPS
jgi:hypothetical protein